MSNNVFKQDLKVSREDRESIKGHKGKVLWFTGLSGSGKSTIASAVHLRLNSRRVHSYMLDGDNMRLGLNKDLDFTKEGRKENIRRIAEVSKLFVDAGVIVLSAFISPFREDRDQAREIIGSENFIEIHVNCPLEVCEKRDVKGLYAKARKGEIKNFTGIDSPYEVPFNPEVTINSHLLSIEDCAIKVIDKIRNEIKID